MHGGQQASAPCRSICCPQVGAPNFREFAWEGDGTVLDCVLCVKLAKQHISLTRSVRSQPCQWDVVMQLIPFGVALCAPSENLVVRIVLLGRFLLRAGESVHAKSKTAVIYSRALERIRAAETKALARMARNKLPRMPCIHRSPRVDYRDRSPVLSAFAWTASSPLFFSRSIGTRIRCPCHRVRGSRRCRVCISILGILHYLLGKHASQHRGIGRHANARARPRHASAQPNVDCVGWSAAASARRTIPYSLARFLSTR